MAEQFTPPTSVQLRKIGVEFELNALPPAKYVEQQLTASTAEQRQEAVTKAANWILDYADAVPLHGGSLVNAVSDEVEGLTWTRRRG